MVDQPFLTWAFPASSAPTSRTMPDRLADIVNVMDFGATGDGATDDTAAIQAAFDAAFGASSVAHGMANSFLNRSVYFPGGVYKCANVLLTQVYGGRIFGAGNVTTSISYNGGASAGAPFVTNGFVNSSIENMNISGANYRSETDGICCIDLDWDGTSGSSESSNWLNSVLLSNISDGYANVSIRVAESGYDGRAITLLHHQTQGSKYGLKLNSDDGMITSVGGGMAACLYAAWINKGSYSAAGSMNAGHYTVGEDPYPGQTDILHESSGTSTFIGTRTESQFNVYATRGKVNLIGCCTSLSPLSSSLNIVVDGAAASGTPAEVTIESCICGDPGGPANQSGLIAGDVTLSMRNVLFGREATDGLPALFSNFTGQITNWLHTTPFTMATLPTKAGDGLTLTVTDAKTATGAWGEEVTSSMATSVGNALVRWNGTSSSWTLVGK